MGKRADTLYNGFLPALGKAGSGKAPTVNRMIRDMFGVRHRKPDVHAAAEQLGVTPATVRRWVKANRLPTRGPNHGRVEASHRQWATSPAGRSSRVNKAQVARLRSSEVVSFTVHGKMRVSETDHSRHSKRTTTFLMDGESAARVWEAAMLGDDAQASELFEMAAGPEFGGSVEFTELSSVRMNW